MGPEGSLLLTDGQGLYHGEWVRKGSKRNLKTFDGPWVNLFQEMLLETARDEGLNGGDFRVLLVLLGRATHESPVFESNPTGIARDLGMHPSTVTRALAKLAERGLIHRPATGKVMLNPYFAWRGGAEARQKWLRSTENAPGASAPR
jgi:hypothetical protein